MPTSTSMLLGRVMNIQGQYAKVLNLYNIHNQIIFRCDFHFKTTIIYVNKAISKAIVYSGLGSLDKMFGFLFGFIWAYIIAVCIFTTVDIIYNHDKWPIKQDGSITYEWVENGSNYLIKVFPDQEQYKDAKDKVQEL